MGIEAVFISNSEGKLLYYRNYSQSLTQFLIEDFAFSLQSSYLKNNQHIFSTHGCYRLVYLPIETSFLVLVTENTSNIVEDVDSIGKIKEVVSNLTDNKLNEEIVFDNYVDLTMAFDEMISLKSRILFDKSQISILLMLESANEKIQQKILEEKAHQTQKKNEAEIKQHERMNKVKEMMKEEINEIDKKMKQFVGESADIDLTFNSKPEKIELKKNQGGQKKGMQLGKVIKKTPPNNLKESEKHEHKSKNQTEDKEVEVKWNPLNDEVKLLLEEKISGQIDSNGDVRKFDLKGSLVLFIENETLDKFSIQTNHFDNCKFISNRLPPNFDKNSFNNGLITLKPKSPSLPKKTVIETLKYNLTTNINTDSAPFKINFWFSGTQFSAEIDFNASQSIFQALENVSISFKKLLAFDFEVTEVENSQFSTENRYLVWKIPLLNRNKGVASLIVNFEETINESSILPADVMIESSQTVYGLAVKSVVDETGREVKYSFRKLLSAKDFTIEV